MIGESTYFGFKTLDRETALFTLLSNDSKVFVVGQNIIFPAWNTVSFLSLAQTQKQDPLFRRLLLVTNEFFFNTERNAMRGDEELGEGGRQNASKPHA